ncbi:LuxR C-terminal-related transcriptional regulator [Agromyces aurantiacus]|uniref:LuxR C-terminal-related transcriptional regulator n=1 Tax=Agromyces aurantiacus TaxID=165814 RepID=A0ABV9R4B9_9MICO|nr:LuxR C-terminal-related transcriptional regulator [Agromyces aurantiacus]MBM7502770.1 LuxR family maltose regulon positive regulatory protein [Agromyces aurantiacus]
MVEHVVSEYMVDRPHLTRRLGEALSCPLTLLVAQAGAGKTVLLTQWVAQHPSLSMAWIDVESADNDPVRFARRLLAALAEGKPEVSRLGALSALGGTGLGDPLLKALHEGLQSDSDLVLVFDDFHHLSNRTLLMDVGRLVAMLPPNVHVIMSTRVDPPIPWSRLRLTNRLIEIRQADLAMTHDESAEMLGRVVGRDLSPAATDLLIARTEGWAAGLQLAGIAVKLHTASDAFIAEFSGNDRLIAEYLTEEVLGAISAERRRLLLQLAPLDTMTAELVNHVLERSDARLVFRRLEDESMFFVGLDTSRTAFRFHQLFRDLLRYHLRSEDPDEERRLLARAADFHLKRSEWGPAIEYLLRAEDWDRALDAVLACGSDVFERGEAGTVIRWITTVPEAAREERLDTWLQLAMLVGMQGEVARTAAMLRRVANDSRATVGQRIIAEAWTSATAQWSARPEECIRAAERAIALLDEHPDAEPPDLMHLTSRMLLRTLALGSGGRARFLDGDLAGAEEWLTAALTTDGISYPPFRVGVLGSLALLDGWCGRTLEAELLAAEAVETAGMSGLLSHPVIADALLAQALVARERAHEDDAATLLEDARVRAEANHRTQLLWIATFERAARCAAEGRFDDALELVDVARHDAPSAPAPVILDRLIGLRMSVLRRMGRPAEALHLVGADQRCTPTVRFEMHAASLALGDTAAAATLLRQGSDRVSAGRPRDEVGDLLLQAWAAELTGSHETALGLMGAALDVAEPEGLVAMFVEPDVAVVRLVEELAGARGGLSDAILTRWGRIAGPHANAALAEPLTERELEILTHLPDHSTSAELATLCFVSVNTVKTHTAHIYRKLGVSGRSAAVAKARELGLIAVSRPDR